MVPGVFLWAQGTGELHLVALLAIPGDAEGVIAVVAGAAGFARLHAGHPHLLTAASFGHEQVGMAFIATEHIDMGGVREGYVAAFLHLVNDIPGMTGDAVAGYAEGLRAVVAGPAGFALFHGLHGDVVAVVLLDEDRRVAATAIGPMHGMAEGNPADGLGLQEETVDPPHRVRGLRNISCSDQQRHDYYPTF